MTDEEFAAFFSRLILEHERSDQCSYPPYEDEPYKHGLYSCLLCEARHFYRLASLIDNKPIGMLVSVYGLHWRWRAERLVAQAMLQRITSKST